MSSLPRQNISSTNHNQSLTAAVETETWHDQRPSHAAVNHGVVIARRALKIAYEQRDDMIEDYLAERIDSYEFAEQLEYHDACCLEAERYLTFCQSAAYGLAAVGK